MTLAEASRESVVVACCGLVESDGSYLLVREGKSRRRLVYNLPGGKLLFRETLAEGVVREVHEETGLVVSPQEIIGVYHCPDTGEGCAVLDVIFWARVTGGEIRITEAHPEVEFVRRSEVETRWESGMLRGSHVLRAIDDFESGMKYPMSTIPLLDWPCP
jgi:ADP-ribose pyrophosphatase YjhB (NUDIX family)